MEGFATFAAAVLVGLCTQMFVCFMDLGIAEVIQVDLSGVSFSAIIIYLHLSGFSFSV